MKPLFFTPANLIRGKMNIKRHGLNLVVGECIGDNAIASARLAYELATSDEYGEVLFINTFQGTWKLDESFSVAIGDWFTENTQEAMSIYDSTIGELALEGEALAMKLLPRYFPIKTVVINSWEFASKDSRSREKLIYMFQDWVTRRGLTVIVFAESLPKEVRAGKIMRGGLGKFAGLIDRVSRVSTEIMQRIRAATENQEMERIESFIAPRYQRDETKLDETKLDEILKEHQITVPLLGPPVCVHSDVVEMEVDKV